MILPAHHQQHQACKNSSCLSKRQIRSANFKQLKLAAQRAFDPDGDEAAEVYEARAKTKSEGSSLDNRLRDRVNESMRKNRRRTCSYESSEDEITYERAEEFGERADLNEVKSAKKQREEGASANAERTSKKARVSVVEQKKRADKVQQERRARDRVLDDQIDRASSWLVRFQQLDERREALIKRKEERRKHYEERRKQRNERSAAWRKQHEEDRKQLDEKRAALSKLRDESNKQYEEWNKQYDERSKQREEERSVRRKQRNEQIYDLRQDAERVNPSLKDQPLWNILFELWYEYNQ